METLAMWAVVYVAALGAAYFLNRRELELDPDKAKRYSALPLHYKAGCWFVIVPLCVAFVLVPLQGQGWLGVLASVALFIAALSAMIGLKVLCVRWYRQNGFFETVEP
jgi:uncharacterized protein YqhQ